MDTVAPHTGRLFFILGPCVIESREETLRIAHHIATLAERLDVQVVFKASFDKANRTRLDAYRGPGIDAGLSILEAVRAATGLPILTDIHTPGQAHPVAEVVDVLQIPAFLCRQTDLLRAAAETGRAIHAKKGQFLSAGDLRHVVAKLKAFGARELWLCERGTCFGSGELVVDMRSLETLRELAEQDDASVVFDATHSVQRPGRPEGATGGRRALIPTLSRAAVAAGVDAVFAEVHPSPDQALCDRACQWPLERLEPLLRMLLHIDQARREALASFQV